MPTVSATSPVIAAFVSDLHLSHHAPKSREERGSQWYQVMEGYLCQLKAVQQWSNNGPIPIFVAGDIFHKWDSVPEIINFALSDMPNVIAIPGNHDLPYHNPEMITKSAYYTLVQAGKITSLPPGKRISVDVDIDVVGFPCGTPLEPLKDARIGIRYVALCHQYIWTEGKSFPGAPQEYHVTEIAKCLEGYSIAFFGDNHNGFMELVGDTLMVNCGGFIRRNTDEIKYKPSIWLLKANGNVERKFLITEGDRISKKVEEGNGEIDIRGLMTLLKDMDVESWDFKERLLRIAQNPKARLTSSARRVVMNILQELM